MREILFRGKRSDTGEWVEGYYCRGFRWAGDKSPTPAIQEADGYSFREIIPETVGQYTGLTDKNGMKIFEGDIIAGKTGVFGIRWSKTICCFVAGENFSIRPYMNQGTMQDYEVIGNIHDNPELLEVKRDGN